MVGGSKKDGAQRPMDMEEIHAAAGTSQENAPASNQGATTTKPSLEEQVQSLAQSVAALTAIITQMNQVPREVPTPPQLQARNQGTSRQETAPLSQQGLQIAPTQVPAMPQQQRIHQEQPPEMHQLLQQTSFLPQEQPPEGQGTTASPELKLPLTRAESTTHRIGDPPRQERGRHHTSFRDESETLVKFSGNDSEMPVNSWVRKVERLAAIGEWNDRDTLFAAIRALTGPASDWFAYSEETIASWTDMREGLVATFGGDVDEAAAVATLQRARPGKDEPLVQYMHRMRRLGHNGGISESLILRYIVDGIPDEPYHKANLYACDNFGQLKIQLDKYNRVKMAARDSLKKPEGGGSQYKSGNKVDKNASGTSTAAGSDKCFNCGRKGHIGRNCPDKKSGKLCYTCHKPGHISSACKEKSSQQQNKQVNLVDGPGRNRSHKNIEVEGTAVRGFIDSGAKMNILRADVWRKIMPKEHLYVEEYEGTLKGFGGTIVKPEGKVALRTLIDGTTYLLEYVIVPTKAVEEEMLIGDPLREVARVILLPDRAVVEPLPGDDYIMFIKEESSETNCALEGVHEKYKERIRQLIEKYEPQVPPEEVPIEMEIILKDETPISRYPRRLSPKENEEVSQQVDEWLRDGVIESSNSEFASSVVVARKKDGSPRICIDYQPLNKVTVKERTPMPIVEDTLDQLEEGIVYCTIDLKNGFQHVKIKPSSRKYTAFVTKNGQFQFIRVPFGLSNAPAVFTRFIRYVFAQLIKEGVIIFFMDDGVIKAKDWEELFKLLERVLQQAARYGLQVNWKKCQLMRRKIEFLGHIVEAGKISPSPAKTATLMEYREPRTTKQIQRFLGLAGYFRKFIANYARIARPLSELLKKDTKFRFGEEQRRAFTTLRTALTEAPVLQLYKQQRETELHTDASKNGYGAILLQRNPESNQLHPVYYMSRKTTPAEEKYSSYELEFMAVVKALEKFYNYLHGLKFKIVTDCAAFTQTMNKSELAPRVARWKMLVDQFDYTIEHRAGTRMQHVDALSRADSIYVVRDSIAARLERAQEHDESIAPIKQILRQQGYKDYVLKHNIVYKGTEGQEKIVVPKGLQEEIIRRAHDIGHFGVKKTVDLLHREYFIPKIEKKTESVIGNCIQCILGGRKAGKAEGLLNPIPKEDTPLHSLHIDHVGPLNATTKNYKHLLVIVDAFTKFTWVFPTKSTGTVETLKKIKILQQHFGNPQRIISDRGTAFTSREFAEFCQKEGIHHQLITTGVPRGNGQVERVNAIVTNTIAKISTENPGKWYKHVSRVQRAINGTYQRSIGTSPFELLFGVKLRTPEDLHLEEMIIKEIADLFQEARSKIRMNARKQIEKIQKENKTYYDSRRKEATKYKEGDIVAIKRTQQGPGLKLSIKFLGPYRVKSCKPHDRYTVVRIEETEGPRETTTSADNMKPWRGFKDDLEEDLESDLSDDEQDVTGQAQEQPGPAAQGEADAPDEETSPSEQ